LALNWVKDNISKFGGDPDRVTLVGHGSGSICASLHLISNQSVGLFSKVILMSGTLATPAFWLNAHPVSIGIAFAEELGIDEEDPELILQELQTKR
jgi:carboxylesterase type B